MADEREILRRLTAILYADVVGYTRLSQADETGTHRALADRLRAVTGQIEQHAGEVVHFAGDAVLAQFGSATRALECAFAIQQGDPEREAAPDALPIRFRIGVNLGDVIVDRGEIYGDAVNTAVRLQTLAEPGGICVSEAVRNAVGRQLQVSYQFLGERRLKNISMPVRAYSVLLGDATASAPAVELEGKPAVAVLPFENLSGDPAHGYFADGLTEDIIRELSRFHGLVVIAHNSTFTYKGKPVKVQDVADALGADFVVEGHLRRSSERLRVNVQLIDAISGHHVWSERYDRASSDVFAIQDDIVRRLVSAIAARVHVAGGGSALRRPAHQIRVYDHVLRGQALVGKGREQNTEARQHYARALAVIPEHPRALVGTALSHIDDYWNGWAEPQQALSCAFDAASRAYAADSSDSKASWVLGLIYLLRKDLEQSGQLLLRATELNPSDADAFAALALYRARAGDLQAARSSIATAQMLNPFPSAWYRWIEGTVHFFAGELNAASSDFVDACDRNPNLIAARVSLIATYAALGCTGPLRAAVRDCFARLPEAGTGRIGAMLPPVSGAVRERIETVLASEAARRADAT